MDNVPQTPAGWHPDPSGVAQLRYWDGQVWTHHVAPYPTAAHTPQAAPQALAPGQHPGANHQAAPREKAMTGATWGVLAATVVVVGGALGALGWGAASASAEIASEAPSVVDGFLAAATTADAAWTDYTTPGVASAASVPLLYGDATAAESIGLKIDYTVGELLYGGQSFADQTEPAGAGIARVPVELTYTFLVDGVEQTATTTQAVWLSRAYYYGDDRPSPVRDDASPSAIGPWRIAGLSRLDIATIDEEPGSLQSSYSAPDDPACRAARSVLARMSEIARVEGFFPALCLSDDDSTNIGEGIDPTALAASFPNITTSSPLQELIGLKESYDFPAPLREYRVAAGDEEYVFVFAAVGVDAQRGAETGVRLISLQKAQNRQQETQTR